MRVHPLDVFEPLSRQRGQTQPHRHHDLAMDHEVELDEEIVVLADRAVDDVLDRYDAGICPVITYGLEDGAEAAERAAWCIPERRQNGVLGEGSGLARIDDGT